MPSLSVVVVTYGSAAALERLLPALADELQPGDELIVVDNGSDDGRPEAARKWFEAQLPGGRVLLDGSGGVSTARNAALRETTARVVCFLDDDERAEPEWLPALRRAWAEAGPPVAAIGGPMRPDWQAPRPPWLADYLFFVVTILDFGEERRRLDLAKREFLWGGNMSLRVDAALGVGGFDPDRGSRPSVPFERGGEEEELQERLVAAGWEIWYEPAAAIDHLIPAERLTRTFFRKFFRQRGLVEAFRGRRRIEALPMLARSSARYVVLRALGHPHAETAVFTWLHAWTLLTARRSRLPRPQPLRSTTRR